MTNKFGAKREGKYASKRESDRAFELRMLERIGKITDLQEQVRFLLIPKQGKEREVCYIADFTYRTQNGEFVVEDVKGFRTRDYILKRKMMLYFHGIAIREVS